MSEQERLKIIQADLASLGRVFHRLAMVDSSDRLQQVLDKLLPRLLKRIGDNQGLLQKEADEAVKGSLNQIHTKLVEMFSHILKRVRNDSSCKLPCKDILNLLVFHQNEDSSGPKVDDAVPALTINLSLTFLNIGLLRCETLELFSMLPGLLACQTWSLSVLEVKARRSQAIQISHLLLRCIELLVKDTNLTNASRETAEAQLTLARKICRERDQIASVVYDLLLDVLLYQPIESTNMPPNGLSQAGHERLLEGYSPVATSWKEEMASRSRMIQLKLAVLDFISPSRRFGLFFSVDTDTKSWSELGVARTVALLVTALGDGALDVSENAQLFLKIHLDAFRSKSGVVSNGLGTGLTLTCDLLRLCLGQANAEALGSKCRKHHMNLLGIDVIGIAPLASSMKRRVVSESTQAEVSEFIASKVMDSNPQLFDQIDVSCIQYVGTLSVEVARKCLSEIASSSGLSMQRAKPFIAAAHLLSAVVVRLSVHYNVHYEVGGEEPEIVEQILMSALRIVCSVLKGVSTRQPTKTSLVGDEGNIAIRDICYGIICTLTRSNHAKLRMGYLFSLGNPPSDSSGAPFAQTETAKLLFGCAVHEEEKLRPRAVAALDALLGAYVIVWRSSTEPMEEVNSTEDIHALDKMSNPWLAQACTNPGNPRPPTFHSKDEDVFLKSLLPLIWTTAQSFQPKTSRVAASRWASELVKHLDLAGASHLLCFLAGDIDSSVASAARDGLGLEKISKTDGQAVDRKTLPSLGEIVQRMLSSVDSTINSVKNYWEFSESGKAIALQLLMLCFLNDIYETGNDSIKLLFSTIVETLRTYGYGPVSSPSLDDLLDTSSDCLRTAITSSRFCRLQVVENLLNFSLKDIMILARECNSSTARRHLASTCGFLLGDNDICSNDGKLSHEAWETENNVREVLSECENAVTAINENRTQHAKTHGSIFLGANLVWAYRKRGFFASCDRRSDQEFAFMNRLLVGLARAMLHVDDTVANACSEGLRIAFSFEDCDAPTLEDSLYSALTVVLDNLSVALRLYGDGDTTDVPRCLTLVRAAGACLAASVPATHKVHYNCRPIEGVRFECVRTLSKLLGSHAFQKDETVALAVGEALGLFGDAYSPHDSVWSSASSAWPVEYDESFAATLSPHELVLFLILRDLLHSSSPQRKTASAPALLGIVARVARGIHGSSDYQRRHLVKAVQMHFTEIFDGFLKVLSHPKCKHFTRENCCLGLAACRGIATHNTDTLISVEAVNHRLLRSFGQTTSFEGSVYIETEEQARARRARERNAVLENEANPEMVEVGGAAGMGEAALGAYREMAEASVSLGRHDILYALLMLSASHPYWLSADARYLYSSASLLGESSLTGNRVSVLELRNALRPHIGKLLPRILRASHDPNKQTQEQMSLLWIGLTGGGADARDLITEHFTATFDVLVSETASKRWRTRVGACGALAEIIVGRDWRALGGGEPVLHDEEIFEDRTDSAGVRLLRLWRVTVRALDDVRGAVRDAGQALARSVRALSSRLCDPSNSLTSGGSKRNREFESTFQMDASAAAATSLRWLVRHGLNQPCAEATGISIAALVDIVGVVRSKILEPLLPELLRSLLLAVSGLEPAALNFLQLRAVEKDDLERLRLQMAQSGPVAIAVSKCLEILPNMSIVVQREVVIQLDAALRLSAGFATRAATADAVATLCSTAPAAFQFVGSSSANPAVRLLRAFYYASEREHGQGAKDKMLHALGSLASLCPGVSVRALALRACRRYTSYTGNMDDPASRRAAAGALRAIAVRGSKHLHDGGKNDIWSRVVLPVAFLGKKDSDDKISKLWSEVWDEGMAIPREQETGSFGTRLEEILLPYLIKTCTDALRDVSWSRRVAGCQSITELCTIGTLSPLPLGSKDEKREMRRNECTCLALRDLIILVTKPKVWEGKSEVVRALVKLSSNWISTSFETSDSLRLFSPPIAMNSGLSQDDLFVGDNFFQKVDLEPMEGDPDIEEVPGQQAEGEAEMDVEFDELDLEESVPVTRHPVIGSEGGSMPVVTFIGLGRLLVGQALPRRSRAERLLSDEILPYRSASLQGFSSLMKCLSPGFDHQKQVLFQHVFKDLVELAVVNGSQTPEPPLLQAGALDSLGSLFWSEMGDPNSDEGYNTSLPPLLDTLREAGGTTQPAWTVREAASICIASLCSNCHVSFLRNPNVIMTLLDTAVHSFEDRKFWRVRLAGLTVIEKLVLRAGKDPSHVEEKQLILESLLPHKEDILKLLRRSMVDTEPKVTALGSEILKLIKWWP